MLKHQPAFILGVLLACGGTPPPVATPSPVAALADEPALVAAPAGGRPLLANEQSAIRRLRERAEELRGLRFESDVEVRIVAAEEIREHANREMREEELREAELLYRTLDLLPATPSLRELVSGVLAAEVLGLYDPSEHRMYVRDDVMAGLARGGNVEAEMVVVHEFVHALQDQRLGLSEVMENERSSDAENAFRSVVEGDASFSMGDENMRRQLLSLTFDTLYAQPSSPELDRAPAILRASLVVPYLAGMTFVARVRAASRNVDDMVRTPPESMEQILHPERYLADDAPLAVEIPQFPELGEGVVEDTLGELELAVYLSRGGRNLALAAAEGWGGDRVRVLRRNNTTAAIWFTVWDSEAEAIEAETTLRGAPVAAEVFRRNGNQLVITRNLSEPEAATVFARIFESD